MLLLTVLGGSEQVIKVLPMMRISPVAYLVFSGFLGVNWDKADSAVNSVPRIGSAQKLCLIGARKRL